MKQSTDRANFQSRDIVTYDVVGDVGRATCSGYDTDVCACYASSALVVNAGSVALHSYEVLIRRGVSYYRVRGVVINWRFFLVFQL